ncbi:MAG: T9SS type A sorting domain-containing protein [Flavobacteriales bacterium]|nr:T9SS type A sorting domain-containing protein [Flavobacteriales bacterium]
MKNNSLVFLLVLILLYNSDLFSQTTNKLGCTQATSQAVLEFNNVRAHLSTQGVFWQNPSIEDAGYQVPKGTGLNTLYSGALWIGGVDPNGQLKIAADEWMGLGNDYWPGPLDEVTGDIDASQCNDFDRFWGMGNAEINLFLSNGTISNNILYWPGKNNPNLSYIPVNHDLAPFVDVNTDGNYNPNDGDYPLIKGDTAIWWVLNDKGNQHTASLSNQPMGIELHVMAYAFATNDDINDMTFYDVDIINKSSFTFSNTYVGIFMDTDIGNYTDDYVGCDTTWNVGYGYNGDDFDENNGSLGYGTKPPLQAVTMIKRPTINSIEYPMASFMSFITGGSSVMDDPQTPSEFYNYMKSKWNDNTHLVYGGNGHSSTGGTVSCSFQYPGNPANSSEWSECSLGNTPGDRKFIMSFGNMEFLPANKISMSFALVYHRPTSGNHCQGVNGLLTSVQHAHNFYNSISTNLNETIAQETTIKFYPNPVSNNLTISLNENMIGNVLIEIYDMQGRLVLSDKRKMQNILKVNISNIPNGNYLLKVLSENGLMGVEKIAINR